MRWADDSNMWRSRWAAIGAAVAVTLGAGGLVTVMAADGTPSSWVPIAPCRVFDTRPGDDNVGPRSTPLAADETHVQQITGTNGNCTVPATATAVSMNVTVVGGTARSFLTIYPAGLATRPKASNLNWVPGAPPTPNKVDVQLSATGALAFYNLAGSAHVLADIVGYYQPATATPGPPGPAGSPGPKPAQVVWVAKSGGDHTTLSAAMAAITDATADKPYLIRIAPGIYDEPGGVTVKSFVDIEGSGRNPTTIQCACTATTELGAGVSTLRLDGSDNEIRSLTVITTGGASNFTSAIQVGASASNVHLNDLDITASGATALRGVDLRSGAVVSDVTISASSNSGGATGVSQSSLQATTLERITVTAVGATTSRALSVSPGSGALVTDSTFTATGSSPSTSTLSIFVEADTTLDGVTANALGGQTPTAMYVFGGSATVDDSTFTASNGTSTVIGLRTGASSGTTLVTGSFISGTTYSVFRGGGTVRIADTKLNGNTSGTPTCLNVYTLSFTPYTCI